MGRMGGVLHYTICFTGAPCNENIKDGGERGTDDFCSCAHCLLEGISVFLSTCVGFVTRDEVEDSNAEEMVVLIII